MRLLLFVSLIAVAAGCSSRTFIPVTYSPDKPDAVLGLVETENADILLENMEVNGKHVIFDVEVLNKANVPMEMSPHSIYYYGAQNPFNPLEPGEDVHSSFGQADEAARGVFALKEERVNKDIRATIRSRQVAATLLVVAATAIIVNEAVQDTKDFNQEVWTTADARRSQTREVLTFAGLISMDVVRAGLEMQQAKEFEDLEYLPEEYFHRTVILGGERMRGKVFFPVRDVDFLRVVVPFGNVDHVFDFRRASGKEMRLIKASRL